MTGLGDECAYLEEIVIDIHQSDIVSINHVLALPILLSFVMTVVVVEQPGRST